MAFKSSLQELQLKNLISRKIFWSSSSKLLSSFSKLWNNKKYMLPKLTEMEWNWIIFTPYGSINNLRQIQLSDSHTKFTGKNKVSNTMSHSCFCQKCLVLAAKYYTRQKGNSMNRSTWMWKSNFVQSIDNLVSLESWDIQEFIFTSFNFRKKDWPGF